MLLQQVAEALQSRRERGMLRGLRYDQGESASGVDFSSNDYLGLARSQELESLVSSEYSRAKAQSPVTNFGSTGSRLLSGDSLYAQRVEHKLQKFFGSESALLFNSGYDANLSLLSSLPQPDTVVLYDELVHNSCREGLRLCRAKSVLPFKHNSASDVSKLLRSEACRGKSVVIVVESLYSMDGDVAPIQLLCDLAEQHTHDALVVVDEAHGTGVFGRGGRGLCDQQGQASRVYCRVITFGKAVGAHGAAIVGPSMLRDYLLNYARPLIYSTSLPLHSLVCIDQAFEFMPQVSHDRQRALLELVELFRTLAIARNLPLAPSHSPIQAVLLPGNERVCQAAKQLQSRGFDLYPIRAPTVPSGEERIRVVLHWFNTSEQVQQLVDALHQVTLV
ncbi:hypothetical protein BASA81_000641 [Batrachochytrium salamandrivorans]|nr:hypothetical protein BASA81_000641 [Batrachochytrium salamandrivorans]